MARNKLKTLKNKLDKLWSQLVRKKYPTCIVCGGSPTQAHHAISRRAQGNGVRWLLSNGVGLCYQCHIHKLHGQAGDKQFLDTYISRLNELIPQSEQENIHQLAHQIVKYSVSDLEDMVKEFEVQLNA